MKREEKLSIKDIVSSAVVIGVLGAVLVGGSIAKANAEGIGEQNTTSQESIAEWYPKDYVITSGSDGMHIEEITMGDYVNETE